MQVRCLAPAKINLALHVTGQREDGYHLLESVVVFAMHGDQLSVRTIEGDSPFSVSARSSGPFAGSVPGDDDNIIVKAAEAMHKSWPEKLTSPLQIQIEKNLPVAAGIGGGSADAAATLLAIAELCNVDLKNADNAGRLDAIALKLGADVPMCLESRTLIAGGIGENIRPAPPLPSLDLVLVNPGIGVSTPEVFKALANWENPPLEEVRGSQWRLWLKNLRNDLEQPAISNAPVIRDVLSEIRRNGAWLARMSGSGATCFGLYENQAACEKAAIRIKQEHPDWWCAVTQTGDFSERAERVPDGGN